MGSIALGSPWLRFREGFPMGTIDLGSLWLIQIVFRRALPDFVVSESDLHLFCRCWCDSGVTEKYRCLNLGYDIPLFCDKNFKNIKDSHAVDSD